MFKSTHNLSRTQFYKIWQGMVQRCTNPNSPNYHLYGGRGITVCDRWLKFENFRDDLHELYLKHVTEFGEKNTSLDRSPNKDGNYELINVRWATWDEQAKNKRSVSSTLNYAEHIFFKHAMHRVLRSLIHETIVVSKYEKYFGCSLKQMRNYIESQFTDGMTWDNYGKDLNDWQIDHILGINNFDLSKEEDRLKCFHYTNLRPMWLNEHKQKSILRTIY